MRITNRSMPLKSHRYRCPGSVPGVGLSAFFFIDGRWVALALRAIEQRGYRAWLKASHPAPPSATALATVEATKAGRVD